MIADCHGVVWSTISVVCSSHLENICGLLDVFPRKAQTTLAHKVAATQHSVGLHSSSALSRGMK